MRYRLSFVGGFRLHPGTLSLADAQLQILKHARHRAVFVRAADQLLWPYVLEVGPAGTRMWRDGVRADAIHPDFEPLANALGRILTPPTTQGVPA